MYTEIIVLIAVLGAGVIGSVVFRKLTLPAAAAGAAIAGCIFAGAGWTGILMMGSFFVNPEGMQENPNDSLSFFTLMMSIVMIISILFNYTLQNIILINQGIIYYSVTESQENISIKREIDSIGQNEE